MRLLPKKEAEEQVATNLALARSSWAEAEALRKATFCLTQDLRMDFVLEALLQSLADLVPYSCARVLIPEGGPHVLSLGEKVYAQTPEPRPEFPLTLNADDSPFLQRILAGQKSVLISDTGQEASWQTFEGHADLRSWLSVPLVASGQYLGFLSVGHSEPNRFNQDHLRRAELLAIPAAAAIQNSRLYERAEIYGEELERRVEDLRQAQATLLQSEEGRRVSEETCGPPVHHNAGGRAVPGCELRIRAPVWESRTEFFLGGIKKSIVQEGRFAAMYDLQLTKSGKKRAVALKHFLPIPPKPPI